jgi:hypothetical protein
MNFYNSYEDRDDDRLGKNDDWKISFYNYYKPCDFCGGNNYKNLIIAKILVQSTIEDSVLSKF